MVFVEALARGLPCVGRNAYAMPEIITPGVNGALVERDDVDELAETIVRVLGDDELYDRCARGAGAVVADHTWSRAARQIVDVVSRELDQVA